VRVPGLVLLAALMLPFGGSAHRKTAEGNRLYGEGQLEDALRVYTEAQVDAPEAPELYYDIGNVLYRQDDFEGAADAYRRALLSAPPELVGPAAFNLGNARYRAEDYQGAVEAYERALRAEPTDADSKRNLELALRALEETPPEESPPPPGGEGEPEPSESQATPESEAGEGSSPEPQGEPAGASDTGEPSPEPEPNAAGAPGMSREEAERLLDGMQEQEQSDLKGEAKRAARGEDREREKDW
jgi:Ca-activated chloride channel family protein